MAGSPDGSFGRRGGEQLVGLLLDRGDGGVVGGLLRPLSSTGDCGAFVGLLGGFEMELSGRFSG